MLEGTHVRGDGETSTGPDEQEVELTMAETFRSTQGLGVVFSAAQNIDRLVTVYRACMRAGRTLVIDLYTATVAEATGNKNIPQSGFPRLRIYVPNRQRILVKQSGQFERVNSVHRHRIFLEEVQEKKSELVMLIQGSTLAELARADCLDGAAAIWSLWPGYLDQPSGARVSRLLEEHSVPLTHLHSSGHARVEDLQVLAAALAPARVVPIHSAAPERFEELFAHVEAHADGEWWAV